MPTFVADPLYFMQPILEAARRLRLTSSRMLVKTSVDYLGTFDPLRTGLEREDRMSGDVDSFTEWASQPFQPNHARDNGHGAEVGERVADALEYIAAQLGEICRKMDHIGSGFGASREDFEQMNELLRKL